jgi:hypothetical protein
MINRSGYKAYLLDGYLLDCPQPALAIPFLPSLSSLLPFNLNLHTQFIVRIELPQLLNQA